MKITLTEEQAKRLKILKEEANPIIQFEQFCLAKIQEVNKIYNKITHTSIIEILNKEVDMGVISKALDYIENSVLDNNRKAYAYIENLPEQDLDLRIDKASDSVTNKISSLQIIVMKLDSLQSLYKEHNLMGSFSDIKPIDVTSIQ